MELTLNCPKCKGNMEQGFLRDLAHGGVNYAANWAKGPPEKSFWAGVKAPKETKEIVTFRCTACGYLESYAK